MALATVLGIALIASLVWVSAGVDIAARPAEVGPLEEQDLRRLDVGLVAIDGAGLISADEARRAVLTDSWNNGEPAVPRASLVKFPDTSIHALRNKPIWILRYPLQDEISPAGIPIPYVYFLVDARDGYVYGSREAAP